jgi:hypothetical protein
LAGLPWTSGALAKAALKGAFEPVSASGFEAVVALLPWTAVGTSALMVRFLSLVWSSRDDHHGAVASAGMAVNWGVSVLLSAVVIWFWPAWLVAPFRAKTLAAGPVWMAAWPALVGISLAAVVGASPMLRGLFQRPLVPAGDLLYVLLRVASAAASAVAGPVSGLCRAAERARTIWGEVAGKWYFAAGGK